MINPQITCMPTQFTPKDTVDLSHFDYPTSGSYNSELVLGTVQIEDKKAVFAVVVSYDERDDLSGGFLLGSGLGYGLNMHTGLVVSNGDAVKEALASDFYTSGRALYNELYQRIMFIWKKTLYGGRNDYRVWESISGIGTDDKEAYASFQYSNVDRYNFELSPADIVITRATPEVIKLAEVYLSTITYTGQLEPLKYIEAVDILNGGEDIVVHSCLRALPA